MTITTNCTERKELVQTIAAHTGERAVYLRAPTYGYQIGSISVDRDGNILGDEEAVQTLFPMLVEHGWVDAPISEHEAGDAAIDSKTDASIEERLDEESETNQETPFPPCTCMPLPLANLTPAQVMNILRMVYARQVLIRAMSESDIIHMDEEIVNRLQEEKPQSMDVIRAILEQSQSIGFLSGVYMDAERIMLGFATEGVPLEKATAVSQLLRHLMEHSIRAKAVRATLIEPEIGAMKYFCHSLLIQLGFGGSDFKATRAALLGHLEGFAAFRTADKMDAHKAKYASNRKETADESTQP